MIAIAGVLGIIALLGIEVFNLNSEVGYLKNRYHILIEEMEYYRRKINEYERSA
jgi:hypothetical protein